MFQPCFSALQTLFLQFFSRLVYILLTKSQNCICHVLTPRRAKTNAVRNFLWWKMHSIVANFEVGKLWNHMPVLLLFLLTGHSPERYAAQCGHSCLGWLWSLDQRHGIQTVPLDTTFPLLRILVFQGSACGSSAPSVKGRFPPHSEQAEPGLFDPEGFRFWFPSCSGFLSLKNTSQARSVDRSASSSSRFLQLEWGTPKKNSMETRSPTKIANQKETIPTLHIWGSTCVLHKFAHPRFPYLNPNGLTTTHSKGTPSQRNGWINPVPSVVEIDETYNLYIIYGYVKPQKCPKSNGIPIEYLGTSFKR